MERKNREKTQQKEKKIEKPSKWKEENERETWEKQKQ